MSEATTPPVEDDGGRPPVVRDKRRVDPETGRLRNPPAGSTSPVEPIVVEPVVVEPVAVEPVAVEPVAVETLAPDEQGLADETSSVDLAAERLADLQRLQAEYVNYRKRVERDRDVARDAGVAKVLDSMLPVLDDIHLARQHGDLEGGPFAAIADKLETALSRHGLTRFGEVGEAFDPAVHEALMRSDAELAEGTTVTTVVQVLQPGYRAGERVLRAARVAVADPA